MGSIRWSDKPRAKDFNSAQSYLSLILPPDEARSLVDRLRRAPTVEQKAKDIERASGVRLLPPDDPKVRGKRRKSGDGEAQSPVLLVRGKLRDGLRLTIADGYHRICASYYADRDAPIPCRIVDME
jgi:hypothetical protein